MCAQCATGQACKFLDASFSIVYDRTAHHNFLIRHSLQCRRGSGIFFNHDTILCLQPEDSILTGPMVPSETRRLQARPIFFSVD